MRARILSASAGAGKTYALAYKFVHDVIKHYPDKPYLYRAILAVTFTNKATEEMKRRILNELHTLITEPDKSNYMKDLLEKLPLKKEQIIERAERIQTSILHDYSRFTILTIDKFFQRILRAFIKELSLDINFNLELENSSILSMGTDSLIDQIPHDEKLQQWMMEFTQERINDNEGWDIRKNLNELGNEIFDEDNLQTILNPISKEELIKVIGAVEKKIKDITAPFQTLGKKAMDIVNGSEFGVEHFKGGNRGGIITYFIAAAEGEFIALNDKYRELTHTSDGWASSSVKKGQLSELKAVAEQLYPILAQMCSIYDDNINNLKLINTLPYIKRTFRSYALLKDIYDKVEEVSSQEGVMLLDQTKSILSRFVSGNDAPFIYEKIGNRFERFMIDEFQDTSAREWKNFVPLLRNAISQAEDEVVLIVGDVKQSIYRWRGGDWRILSEGVEQALGKENIFPDKLKDNWRSLPQIVTFNNDMMRDIVTKDNEALNTELKNAVQQGQLSSKVEAELKGTLDNAYKNLEQTPKKDGDDKGYVRIEYYNSKEEIPLIKCIEAAIARGYSYKDILILCRSNETIKKVAEILLQYKQTNKEFNIMTQEALVIGNASISQFVISLMRLSQNPGDNISRAIVNDYLQRSYDMPLPEEEADLLMNIGQTTVEEAFEHIVTFYHLDQRPNEIAYLQAMHEQVINFCASKVADIQLFLKMWDEKGFKQSVSVEMNDNTIEVSTIHKAKGLERKVVIVPCLWGVDPRGGDFIWVTPSDNDNDFGALGRYPVVFNKDLTTSAFSDYYYREKVYSHVDNINMLYVALTRAEEELHMLIPDSSRGVTVGKMIWDVVCKRNETDKIIIANEGENPYVEYGKPREQAPQKEEEKGNSSVLISEYPTTLTKLKIRLPEQRYFEEEGTSLSPLNEGILMHSILNDATDADDIIARIDKSIEMGKLSQQQASKLKKIIKREFEREQAREWFGEWDEVRNENDIIFGTAGTNRPDRVMIKGNRAVAVDYKFGKNILSDHENQVKEYMELLEKMGYTEVEGYVWYLSIGKIVKVEK